MNPTALPKRVWDPLRKFKLVRTVNEQRYHLLHRAVVVEGPKSNYSTGVQRALKAALYSDPRTQGLDVVFKSGALAELDLLLDGDVLEINDKWLDFEKSHASFPCSLSILASNEDSDIETDVFTCYHVITHLLRQILVDIVKEYNEKESIAVSRKKIVSLCLRVADNLRQMPQDIKCTPGREPRELLVTWCDPQSNSLAKLHRVSLLCRITLHRDRTCSKKRLDLVELGSKCFFKF
jgi:hypothetical protein